jgi:hypothetical protein
MAASNRGICNGRSRLRSRSPGRGLGSARVGGVGYDLAQGSLFLMATRGGAPSVKQLDLDLSGLNSGGSVTGLRQLAEASPDISAYFSPPGPEQSAP